MAIVRREATPDMVALHELTPEEEREIFQRQAMENLGMTGDEFIAAWDAGKFDDNPDRPEVISVVMLLPLARRSG